MLQLRSGWKVTSLGSQKARLRMVGEDNGKGAEFQVRDMRLEGQVRGEVGTGEGTESRDRRVEVGTVGRGRNRRREADKGRKRGV